MLSTSRCSTFQNPTISINMVTNFPARSPELNENENLKKTSITYSTEKLEENKRPTSCKDLAKLSC